MHFGGKSTGVGTYELGVVTAWKVLEGEMKDGAFQEGEPGDDLKDASSCGVAVYVLEESF